MNICLKNYLKNDRGATVVEYAIILFFIVLAVVVVVIALQGESKLVFNAVANKVQSFGTIE